MDIKQIQTLLKSLDCDPGAIDGIWGAKSQAALDKALRNYVTNTTEKPQKNVATFWDDIKYFDRSEFRCPCGNCSGFPAEQQERLVRILDQIRAHFGKPAHITSGVRCQQHNDELPNSAKNSKHLFGAAADFWVEGVSGAVLDAYVGSFPEIKYHYRINGKDTIHINI